MRPLEELSQFVELMRPLMKPASSITSLGQLSRFARIQDDKARRVIARMAESCGGDPLVELKGRRYLLTTVGREIVSVGERLLAVGRMQDAEGLNEVLTVEVDTRIDFRFFTDALRKFQEEFSGLVTVKFLPFDPEGIRQNIQSGVTAFALALAPEDGATGASLLGTPVQWSLIVPSDHPLSEETDAIQISEVSSSALLFLPGPFAEHFAATVSSGPNALMLPTAEAVRIAVAEKLGVGLDADFGSDCGEEHYLRRPVAGVPSFRLSLHLPKKQEGLSEAARFLLGLIKAPRRPASPVQSRPDTGEHVAEPDSELLPV